MVSFELARRSVVNRTGLSFETFDAQTERDGRGQETARTREITSLQQ